MKKHIFMDFRYLEVFSQLSKILPDLEFSVKGLVEVFRVFAPSFKPLTPVPKHPQVG